MGYHGGLDQGICKRPGTGSMRVRHLPDNQNPDQVVLFAAVRLVLSQGIPPDRDTDDTGLIRQICEQVPAAPSGTCRAAVTRARNLSRDAYRVCDAFRDGNYGSGSGAEDAALRALEAMSPGFSTSDYRQAFAAGLLWTAF